MRLIISILKFLEMESSGQELLALLQAQKDWHKSAIFTDKGEIITANKCTLLPEEIK